MSAYPVPVLMTIAWPQIGNSYGLERSLVAASAAKDPNGQRVSLSRRI